MEPNQSEVKLNDLPESRDEFWDKAEVELSDMSTRRKTHEHYFTRVTAREIQCSCGFGLYLGDELDDLRDGHLYVDDKLVI